MGYRFTPQHNLSAFGTPAARWTAWNHTRGVVMGHTAETILDVSGNDRHLGVVGDNYRALIIEDGGWGVPGLWFSRSAYTNSWGQLGGNADKTFITVVASTANAGTFRRYWQVTDNFGLLTGNPPSTIHAGYWVYNNAIGAHTVASPILPSTTSRPDIVILSRSAGGVLRLSVNGAITTYTQQNAIDTARIVLGMYYVTSTGLYYPNESQDFMFHELIVLPAFYTEADILAMNSALQRAYRAQ